MVSARSDGSAKLVGETSGQLDRFVRLEDRFVLTSLATIAIEPFEALAWSMTQAARGSNSVSPDAEPNPEASNQV
jgi:hypothetical protein